LKEHEIVAAEGKREGSCLWKGAGRNRKNQKSEGIFSETELFFRCSWRLSSKNKIIKRESGKVRRCKAEKPRERTAVNDQRSTLYLSD
jgi:hypothetical protein